MRILAAGDPLLHHLRGPGMLTHLINALCAVAMVAVVGAVILAYVGMIR